MCLDVQVKVFEEVAGDAQAYRVAASVASDLRGLLEGSSRVSPRKGGVGTPHSILAVPQVTSAVLHSQLTVADSFLQWKSILTEVLGLFVC
jgi:histidine ammonia-lyase